jgi:hypothetical protein
MNTPATDPRVAEALCCVEVMVQVSSPESRPISTHDARTVALILRFFYRDYSGGGLDRRQTHSLWTERRHVPISASAPVIIPDLLELAAENQLHDPLKAFVRETIAGIRHDLQRSCDVHERTDMLVIEIL